MTSQTSLVRTLKQEDGNYTLPKKYDDEFTQDGATMVTQMAKAYFPELPTTSCNMLFLTAKEEGWTDKEYMDKVKLVAKTCIYPKPTIANFIDAESSIKVLTHSQWISLPTNEIKMYRSVRIPGMDKPLWASKYDIKKYDLEPFNPDK